MRDFDTVWDYLFLHGKSKTPTAINFAKVLMVLDLPLKKRDCVTFGNLLYIPMKFTPRNPESIKRKLNRWKKKNSALDSQRNLVRLLQKSLFLDLERINLIEIPTTRSNLIPLFLVTKDLFLLILMTKDSKISEVLSKGDCFIWKNYSCGVISLTKTKFWTTLGSWSLKTMSDSHKDLDFGLFEFVLLNDLNLLDIESRSWRRQYKGYYSESILSWMTSFTDFFATKNLSKSLPKKKLRK